MTVKNTLLKKCERIKLVLTDVDGVLTDGGMYYSMEGDVMKKFHVRDGMGLTLLKRNLIPTILVTKEDTTMVRKWAKRMKVKKLYSGIIKKELILDKICAAYNLKPTEISYIGDDVNDLELMKKVGLAVTPKDGVKEAKKVADYVCSSYGGQGVLREVADLILLAKFGSKRKLY